MLAIGVFNHQFATLIALRIAKEQRRRQISAHPARLAVLANGAIDVKTIGLPWPIAVKQRRGNRPRQRGGKKLRMAAQHIEHSGLQAGIQRVRVSICWFCLTAAPWLPTVTRPSTHSACASCRVNSATWSVDSTSGM